MAAVTARSTPETPTKKKTDKFEDIIRRLNSDYSLGIVHPDPNLSPARRKTLAKTIAEERRDKIYRRLRYLSFKHYGTLRRLLETFDDAARLARSQWVRKPHADRDTLPDTSARPLASTIEEQNELQSLLMDILEEVSPQNDSSRTFARTQSGPAALQHRDPRLSDDDRKRPDPRPLGASSKRRSGDGLDSSSSKRAKGDSSSGEASPLVSKEIDEHVARAILTGRSAYEKKPDSVPIEPLYPSLRTSYMTNKSSRSVHTTDSDDTSRVSFKSAVFSVPDNEPPVSTQTTVEASTQEQKRHGESVYQTQDPFVSSSSDVTALHEPFSRHDHETVGRAVATDPQIALRPRSPDRETVYSSIPDFSDIMDAELQMDFDRPNSELDRSVPRVPSTAADPILPPDLTGRLKCIWPKFPRWLHPAPLPFAWEVTRIALHCGVNLDDINMKFDPTWTDQKKLRSALWSQSEFRGKTFPPSSNSDAWSASLSTFRHNELDVVLSASVVFNEDASGPPFKVKLQPLKLDLSYRLSRRFGPDRFLELLVPSPSSWNVPSWLKNDDVAIDEVKKWLANEPHFICGRQWAAFYTKDAGYKKPAREVRLGPEPKAIFMDRVYLFAEDGMHFARGSADGLPSEKEPPHHRTRLERTQMLDWALELRSNLSQPYLKLFQRLALVLSKTSPAIVFSRGQIRNGTPDIRSPTGKVMNDGVGRMSRSVALKIRDNLKLTDIPCAIQGRLGSAKGKMGVDLEQRGASTLEVRSHAVELRSARFNLQFLPVLEDRAPDKDSFRRVVGKLLKDNLQKDLDGLKTSMNSPLQFRQWVHESSSRRQDRLRHGYVPYLGGLPEGDEETMNLLLDGGFDPRRQKSLQDLAWQMQDAKCKTLKKKLNIQIDMSAYIYMVVDFQGVLEENEVHLGFSSKFQVDGFADTLLDGIDILVARSPAHFVSDVQKVRAVFKLELRALKDVIIFSSKGNSPLADKLSGGDYDGDLAWVCWDQRIVNNFQNAEVPPVSDLFENGFLRQIKETLYDLHWGHDLPAAVSEMITRSFSFNMNQSLLGRCTNYKERLCYKRQNVNDEKAVLLSTLLSHLVDQAKQGTVFTTKEFNELLKYGLKEPRDLPEPAFKGDNWPSKQWPPANIIDYLKFYIAKPAIDRELAALFNAMKSPTETSPRKLLGKSIMSPGPSENGAAHFWDKGLVMYYDEWEQMSKDSRSKKALFSALKLDIEKVEARWKVLMASDTDYADKIKGVHEEWVNIKPNTKGHRALEHSTTVSMLQQPLVDPELSQWALLRASAAFKLCYRTSPSFVWRMAGRQLAHIKAMRSCKAGGESAPVLVVPEMYAALRPDSKYITKAVARLQGDASEYMGDEDISDVEEDDA